MDPGLASPRKLSREKLKNTTFVGSCLFFFVFLQQRKKIQPGKKTSLYICSVFASFFLSV